VALGSGSEKQKSLEVEVGGRVLRMTNLDKVLYPSNGFTKGQVIDYYTRIAPVILPHLSERPITLHRFPNGVESSGFYEKNCPKHRPDWIRSVDIEASRKVMHQCLIDETAALAWLGNLACLEIHPNLARWTDMQQPTKLTFDLDPGSPATIVDCCRTALVLRDLFEHMGLQAFPKTSGSKGMQLEVPVNSPVTYAQTKPFAHSVAQLLAKQFPTDVVSEMDKSLRGGKVFIDWSQNDQVKTTVSAYSLRARPLPWVSTPLTWDEVEQASTAERTDPVLRFETKDVFDRLDQYGDLSAPVNELRQSLPELG
jgi:bifunctional non-homologous end joining protein LigD